MTSIGFCPIITRVVSDFSLESSIAQAERRLGLTHKPRRADAGRSRLPTVVEAELGRLLSGYERPRIADVHRELDRFCRRRRLTTPSRSTLYNVLQRVTPPSFDKSQLPGAVRRTLHNVDAGPIPGHQVAFAAFNYGDTKALSFAAGLPWLCLYQSARLRGWRPQSFALLQAILAYRGIPL